MHLRECIESTAIRSGLLGKDEPMKPLKVFLSLILAALVTSAAAQTISVEHVQGTTNVPVMPQKIFSFDYAAIDTLQLLGVDVAGLPPLANSPFEFGAEDAISIGSLFDPDYELIAAEMPDLIIIGGRSADQYNELSRLAPTIDLSFDSDDMYADFARNTRILAEIVGKENEAEALMAGFADRLAALQEKVAAGGNGLIVMVNGGTLTALADTNARAGRGSLLYHTLGLKPAVANVAAATHGDPISFEFLLQYNPDNLFILDRDAAIGTEGASPAKQVLDNEIMHQTAAWKNDAIVYLHPFDWYIITGAGLQSMDRMITELEAVY